MSLSQIKPVVGLTVVIMHGGMMITLLPHLIDKDSQECVKNAVFWHGSWFV